MIPQNLLRFSLVLGAICVLLSFVHSVTFEELQTWQGELSALISKLKLYFIFVTLKLIKKSIF